MKKVLYILEKPWYNIINNQKGSTIIMKNIIIKTYADGEHMETFEFDCVKKAKSLYRTLNRIHKSKWLEHKWTAVWSEA